MTSLKEESKSKDIWMVEHPCGPEVKAKAAKDGCRVVDIRFANAVPPSRVKKVVKKVEKSKPVTEDDK